MLPHCDDCQFVIWYPRRFCPACGSRNVSWFDAAGTGSVYTFTIVAKGTGAYRDAGPYVVAFVELDEGPRLMTNIVDVQPDVGVRRSTCHGGLHADRGRHCSATLPSGMSHDAFISYSHAADGRIAPAVERGLQRLAKPWNRLRAVSVFRDQSDLALNPHLWTTISTALDGSRYFILLACPESAASIWVNREVAHWCDTKGTEHLLVVVTGGELAWDPDGGDFSEGSTAVPAALRGRFSEEPLYLDLRWARDVPELTLRLSRFRAAIAQIAAPIRGVPPDELEGEDIRLHRRARVLARAAVATVAVLAIVATVAAIIAVGNARRADRRAREALGRQLGLAALDLPAGQLDEAFLLSLAAADLQDDDDASRFQASRALIGRYSRLVALLHPAEDTTRGISFRGVDVAPDGRIIATAWSPDGSAALLSWKDGLQAEAISRGRPRRLLPVGRLRRRQRTDRDRGDGRARRHRRRKGAEVTPLGDRVVDIDLAGGRALVVADDGTLDLVDVADGERIASTSVAPIDGAEGDAPLADLANGRVVVASEGRIVLLGSNDGEEQASVDDATTLDGDRGRPDRERGGARRLGRRDDPDLESRRRFARRRPTPSRRQSRSAGRASSWHRPTADGCWSRATPGRRWSISRRVPPKASSSARQGWSRSILPAGTWRSAARN